MQTSSTRLKKDIVPHSLRFKFEITPSKITKNLPEFKALTERASNALSNFQAEAKMIVVDAINLEVRQVWELHTKSIIDGIAQLASDFMTFYGISSSNATTDPMVKYHLFNSIAHKDFDTLFLSTDDSGRSSYTTRQADKIFRQSGHFGSEESHERPSTDELKTLYKSFEEICVKLFAYPADHFRRAQLAFDATQAVDKLSKEVITGERLAQFLRS